MPYYLSKTKEQDAETQKHGLTELARYVRATDPHHHPITIHPSSAARECVDDPSVLDFDMLQTGHSDRQSVPNTIETVNRELAATPKMPVLIGEVCYEGIQEASRQEVQRFMFWSALLSGTGGPHLRRQRHLAGEHAREALWPFAAWPLVGRAGVGHRRRAARFGTTGNGQGPADALLLVETGAAAGSDRSALEQGGLLEAVCRARFPARRSSRLRPLRTAVQRSAISRPVPIARSSSIPRMEARRRSAASLPTQAARGRLPKFPSSRIGLWCWKQGMNPSRRTDPAVERGRIPRRLLRGFSPRRRQPRFSRHRVVAARWHSRSSSTNFLREYRAEYVPEQLADYDVLISLKPRVTAAIARRRIAAVRNRPLWRGIRQCRSQRLHGARHRRLHHAGRRGSARRRVDCAPGPGAFASPAAQRPHGAPGTLGGKHASPGPRAARSRGRHHRTWATSHREAVRLLRVLNVRRFLAFDPYASPDSAPRNSAWSWFRSMNCCAIPITFW